MNAKESDLSKGKNIKPKVNEEEALLIVEKYYGLKGCSLKPLKGYDDINYWCSAKETCNPFIQELWSHGYVIKITNSLNSKLSAFIEAQNSLMIFLRKNNVPASIPAKDVQGNYFLKIKFPITLSSKEDEREHIVRLLEFQPGTEMANVPKSFLLFYQAGKFLAQLDECLKNFSHPFYENHQTQWHLQSVPALKSFLDIVEVKKNQKLAETIIDAFIGKVKKVEGSLEKGMIHGDFNEQNILLIKSENGNWKISSVIDFEDSHHSYYLYELAIAVCYIMMECKRHNFNFVIGAGHLIAGYLCIRPTFVIDYELLKISVCARICQSLILGLKTTKVDPHNAYILSSQDVGWSLVEEFWQIPTNDVIDTWKSAIYFYKIKTQNTIQK